MATYTANIETLQRVIAATPFDIDPETDRELNQLLIQLKREVVDALTQRSKEGKPMWAETGEVYFNMDTENSQFKKACQDDSPARKQIELWDYPKKGLTYFMLLKRSREAKRI